MKFMFRILMLLPALIAAGCLVVVHESEHHEQPVVVDTAERLQSGLTIDSGPMIGHVGPDEARVWLRVKEGASVSGVASQNGRSHRGRVEDLGNRFFLLHFRGLEPDTPAKAVIQVKKGGGSTQSNIEFRTAPAPSNTGRVRIAFGSCAKFPQHGDAPVYERMAEEQPDVAIFVGDNSYFIVGDGDFGTSGPKGDWNSYDQMIDRHLENRNSPMLQNLLRSVPTYAVWDDHDYGPNNADRTFELKDEALKAFSQMWANPSYGEAENKGIYSSFRRGPVEIFLMDDRYHKYVSTDKHPDVSPEEATIWGERQLEWLLEGLKQSTAPVKVIANGTQVISMMEQGEGHYQEARNEQRRLLDFIRDNKIGGVIFLSGDRHFSEVMRIKEDGAAALYEFTSSPLQQGQKVGPLNNENKARLWGMRGNSYGLVTIDIPEEGSGTIRMEARDEENLVPILNAARCVTTVNLREISYE